MGGGVWCSLCLGFKVLMGVSECARKPGGLSEDISKPPALPRPYLWVELQQGEKVLSELLLKPTAGSSEGWWEGALNRGIF